MAQESIGKMRDVTPNDDAVLEGFDWVMVNVSGSLAVEHSNGTVTNLASVPAGVHIPMDGGVRVLETGTDATGIMVV